MKINMHIVSRLQKEGVRVSALERQLREERSRVAELETELSAVRGPVLVRIASSTGTPTCKI